MATRTASNRTPASTADEPLGTPPVVLSDGKAAPIEDPGGETAAEQPPDDRGTIATAAATPRTTTPTAAACSTTGTAANAKPSLAEYLNDLVASETFLPMLLVATLWSFSMGLTVGIVPEILTDRCARLYHGYGSDGESDGRPCWEYHSGGTGDGSTDETSALLPEACSLGADDAQAQSADSVFVQSLLMFACNAAVGAYSDGHGRRLPLVAGVALTAVLPAATLAATIAVPALDTSWYYASSACSGFVPAEGLLFAALSDDASAPAGYRAGRFSALLGGMYGSFLVAPYLSSVVFRSSHAGASLASLAMSVLALGVAALWLPETLPEERQHRRRTTGGDPPAPARGSSFRSAAVSCAKTLVLEPLAQLAILTRTRALRLVAIASFVAAFVYRTDAALFLFYAEEYLDVTEDDVASLFLLSGILAVLLQGLGTPLLAGILGEKGLLVLAFCSGTVHNLGYGIARNKTALMAASGLSQLTKLGYPILGAMASKRVEPSEQGRVQGALSGWNALAGAVGPVSMQKVYEHTRFHRSHRIDGHGDSLIGPGTMFLVLSAMYFCGTVVACLIPSSPGDAGGAAPSDADASTTTTTTTLSSLEAGALDEPLLPRTREECEDPTATL